MTDRNKPDPSTDVTVPAMQAQGERQQPHVPQFPKRPQTITNLELMDGIQSMERNIGGQLGDLKRGLRDLGNQVDDIVADQKKDRVRLAKVEAAQAGISRPRAPSLHGLEEGDLHETNGALSADQRFERIERGTIRTRKQTNVQTGVIVSTLVALAVAGAGFLNAQAERTRSETAHAAEISAREAAAAAARAAAEAVKHPGAPTP